MKRLAPLLSLLAAVSLSCLAPAIAATVTPAPSATPRPTAYIESVNDAFATSLDTFVATTDTNLRVCGRLDCAVINDVIRAGEAVVATRPIGGEWALIVGRGWFCVAALTGGGCKK